MRRRRLPALALAAALLAGLAPVAARADGDPASDYLVAQTVFLPYDAKIPAADQRKLLATVAQATKQGFPIRVALIWSDYDLGSVTALWHKPKLYARFLGAELLYYYRGRLLIVMPRGFGFNYPGHGTSRETAMLSSIPIAATPAGLAQAASTAVERLAAQAGVHVSASARTAAPASHTTSDRITIIVAVLAALLIGALARLFVRRRASARPTS